MNKLAKIYIAGHRGLVGSAIVRALTREGYNNLIYRTRKELELTNQQAVAHFFEKEKPEYIFLAAAKVGGILANKMEKADFIYDNLQVQNNIIYNSWKHKVKKLLFLGSSCIYPRDCPQPIKEEYFLTGKLEETNDAYAVAKIAGIKMCQSYNEQYKTNYISVMPTNLYGPNDNFDLTHAHVLPALIRKFHEAKIHNNPAVTLWGTGGVFREFLYVDDLAEACLFLMKTYNDSNIINIGSGKDYTIRQMAQKIKKIVGFKGKIIWDSTKPNGTPRKLLDTSKINTLGWKPRIDLEVGLEMAYEWLKENYTNAIR